MSTASATSSRYASPAPATPTSSVSTPSLAATTASKALPAKQKPVNVFTDDGSFLDRIQRSKREGEEKRKAQDALERKRQFADRFKSRGKRHLPPPDTSPAVTTTDAEESPAKKAKLDEASLNYQKEVRNQEGRILKDTGTGVRPLVK